MDTSLVEDLREATGEINSFYNGSWHRNKIWTG